MTLLGLKTFKKLNLIQVLFGLSVAMFIFAKGVEVKAHGEDKPGPHGGFIQMPGAFHTEVVAEGDHRLKVYLLDMNWENPSTKDSSLEVKLQLGKKTTSFKCEMSENFYSCTLPKGNNLKKGKLEVQAQREGVKGSVAAYTLPLQWKKAEKSKEHQEHSGHHH